MVKPAPNDIANGSCSTALPRFGVAAAREKWDLLSRVSKSVRVEDRSEQNLESTILSGQNSDKRCLCDFNDSTCQRHLNSPLMLHRYRLRHILSR